MWYVYILRDRIARRFYIGLTKDISRRMKQHNRGHTHTTARFKDKQLMFYEAYISEVDARRREKYFKTTKGRQALRLMLQDTLTNKDTKIYARNPEPELA